MPTQIEATHTVTMVATFAHGAGKRLAEHTIGVIIDGPFIQAVDIPPRNGAPRLFHNMPESYKWHSASGVRTDVKKRRSWQQIDLDSLLKIE